MKQKKIVIYYNEREVKKENGTRTEKDKKEFTLQHPGLGWYLDTMDQAKIKGEGVVTNSRYAWEQYLENVVVDPKMEISDFDKIDGGFDLAVKLMAECESFLTA